MKQFLMRVYVRARFGKITKCIKSTDDGYVSEVEYRDGNGRIIGYYAYGYWDPVLPYKGQDK